MPELPFTLDQLRILKAIAAQGSFKKLIFKILNCQLKNSDKNDELNVLTAIFIY